MKTLLLAHSRHASSIATLMSVLLATAYVRADDAELNGYYGNNENEPVAQEVQLTAETHEALSDSSDRHDWVDPTLQEIMPCGKCGDAACPGVNKDPGHPPKPKHPRPGDINEGDCPSKRYRTDDRLRSGDPYCVYKWAVPSITPKYSAWYVGGGAALKGRGRKASEGTWGLDYDGLFGHARTWMNYTCGKKQGGEGAYETDHVPLKKKF
jgi:hypothetical protein